MKKVFAFALLMSACCNVAWAATSPLASTNDYYYTQPKTGSISGRVMGENADYRLVRAEDAAFINEAWEERYALGETSWQLGETVPGVPLVRSGGRAHTWSYWASASIEECVLQTEDMEGRLAEASGGAMTNIVLDVKWTNRLVSVEKITKQYEELKRAKVLAKEATVTFTNVDAKVVETLLRRSSEGQPRTEVTTNEVQGGEWQISGSGQKYIDDGIVEDEEGPKWAGKSGGQKMSMKSKCQGA